MFEAAAVDEAIFKSSFRGLWRALPCTDGDPGSFLTITFGLLTFLMLSASLAAKFTQSRVTYDFGDFLPSGGERSVMVLCDGASIMVAS